MATLADEARHQPGTGSITLCPWMMARAQLADEVIGSLLTLAVPIVTKHQGRIKKELCCSAKVKERETEGKKSPIWKNNLQAIAKVLLFYQADCQ